MVDDDPYDGIDANQMIVDQQSLDSDEIRGFVQDFGTDKQRETYRILNGGMNQQIDWEAELIVYEPANGTDELKYRIDIGQKGKHGSLPTLEGSIDMDDLDRKQEQQYAKMERNQAYLM